MPGLQDYVPGRAAPFNHGGLSTMPPTRPPFGAPPYHRSNFTPVQATGPHSGNSWMHYEHQRPPPTSSRDEQPRQRSFSRPRSSERDWQNNPNSNNNRRSKNNNNSRTDNWAEERDVGSGRGADKRRRAASALPAAPGKGNKPKQSPAKNQVPLDRQAHPNPSKHNAKQRNMPNILRPKSPTKKNRKLSFGELTSESPPFSARL